MQGLWAMVFRGAKASIEKLNVSVQMMESQELYRDFTADWRRGRSVPADFDALADTQAVTIRVDTGKSCNITGMDHIFRELVKLVPELEAAYCENGLDASDFKHILYSKPGSKAAVKRTAVCERTGAEIDMYECEEAAGVDDEEDEEWELSPKDAARLLEDFREVVEEQGRMEPSPFEFTYCGVTYNAADGRYDKGLQTGDWCWVLEHGPGRWRIDNSKYAFVLELLGLDAP